MISMTAAMLNGDDDTVGFMTSGGTESILMAVKTFRDRAKSLYPHIKNPEIVSNVCPVVVVVFVAVVVVVVACIHANRRTNIVLKTY